MFHRSRGLFGRFTLLGGAALLLVLFASGCASSCARKPFADRPFVFKQDTFAYANDLLWEYHFDDATGKTTTKTREPAPEYTHHCFVVARGARQFFQHARFDPALPAADEATYRRLIRRVVAVDPSRCLKEKIVIPGYTNLYAFSQAQAKLLQAECGGAWRSYCQRGHWRIMLPFSRSHQEAMARQLAESVQQNRPPVIHLAKFPQLTINHAAVVFAARETEQEILFSVYDPFNPNEPTTLTFDRLTRSFLFPRNAYFIGGPLNVYEIYYRWNY